MLDTLIIGIGHQARQGKDEFAEVFKKLYPDKVQILHFADPLKEEVTNAERLKPLIYKEGDHYYLLDKRDYIVKYKNEVPYLHDIFTKRSINVYFGMNEKDSEMLQFWGTDFRRAQDNLYWVKKTMNMIVVELNPTIYLIPDVRFQNEISAIRGSSIIKPHEIPYQNRHYIKVVRFDEKGRRFYDKNRDRNHPSEVDLLDYRPDFLLVNDSTLKRYHEKCEKFIKRNFNI